MQLGKDEGIICVAANYDENELFAITKSGQLISSKINLRTESEFDYEPLFEYVICPFHKAEVTGLSVCVRKQLIATCSADRTVCIWNYETK